MRPKGSGYRTQSQILESLRQSPDGLWFGQVVSLLGGDRVKASRNLNILLEQGLVTKHRVGHKVVYSLTEGGNSWTDWEGRRFIKRLLEQKRPEWLEDWLNSLPRDFEELDLEDPRTEKLWKEYSVEIGDLYDKDPEMKKATVSEIIYWAKKHRELKTEMKFRHISRHTRQPNAKTFIKKPNTNRATE